MTGLTPAPQNPQPFSVGFNTGPSFDVIADLPSGAAAKLRALRQRSTDAHSLIPEFEQIREASEAKQSAGNALKRLTDHRSLGGFDLEDSDGRVIAARKTLDKANADFKRLTALQSTRSAAWQAASAALQSVELWIRDRPPGTALRDHASKVPTLSKGEDITDAVERHRHRVRELRADIAKIATAPYPSSHAKQRMRQQIETLAQRGSISVSHLIGHDRDLVLPTMQVTAAIGNVEAHGAFAIVEVFDAAACWCWLHKDALIARLDVEISSEADDKSALTYAEREHRTAEVKTDLLAIERQEAALTWRAMDEKLPIEFRHDHDPVALELVTAVAVPDNRGSAFEHALDIVGLGRR